MHRVRQYGRQTWMVENITGVTCLGVVLGWPMTETRPADDSRQPANLRNGARLTPASAIQHEGTLP